MIQDIAIYVMFAAGALSLVILLNVGAGIYLAGKAKKKAVQAGKLSVYAKMTAFVLFLIIGFSLIPIMVKFFTDALPEIITESPLTETLQKNAMVIVYGFWVVYAIGMALAFPAMKKGGFFDPESPEPLKPQEPPKN